MSKLTVYIVTQNSDTTEGRGRKIDIGWFLNEADAYHHAQGKGVMGVGPGGIDKVTVSDNDDDDPFIRDTIYTYRQNSAGKWSVSWVDGRDDPDPENNKDFKEYLRLKRIFG